MNPRVLLWLAAAGLAPADIARRSGEDVPRVTVGGERNLWTVHYTCWIGARWREWARTKGFRDPVAAQLAGHVDFDEWLEACLGLCVNGGRT